MGHALSWSPYLQSLLGAEELALNQEAIRPLPVPSLTLSVDLVVIKNRLWGPLMLQGDHI